MNPCGPMTVEMNTIGRFAHLTENEKRATRIHRRFSIDLISGPPFGIRDLVALLGPGGQGYDGCGRDRYVPAIAELSGGNAVVV